MVKTGVAAGVIKGLGQIAEETGKKAISGSIDVAAQALGEVGIGVSSPPEEKEKNESALDKLKKSEQKEEEKEIIGIRRDIEAEIEQVRQEKKIKLEQEEEEFLRQLQEKRKKEEEELEKWQEPITPSGKKPRGLPPWMVKSKQGTKETGMKTKE